MQNENLAYQGQKLRVVFAIKGNGRMPAKEFLQNSQQEMTRLFGLILRLAEDGSLSSSEQFKKLKFKGEYPLWEFKCYQLRLLCVYPHKGSVILTNGFVKKQARTPAEEMKKALNIAKDYLTNLSKGEMR